MHAQPWPEYDDELARAERVTLVVQINGKVRERIAVDADISREEMENVARGSDRISALLQGKEIVKIIVVPGKLVNIVVR